MTVTQIKELTLKRVLVTLDDDYSFPFYLSELKKRNIEIGAKLDGKDLEDIKYGVLYPTALNKSLYLLKAKEYTRREIELKLIKASYPEDIIESVINELIANRFIDDKRYTESYIAYHGSLKSAQALKSALIQKGIDKDIIDSALDEYMSENPENEYEQCMRLLESRYFADRNEAGFQLISKAKMYLARKGYSFDTCDRAVKEFFDI